MKKMIAEQRPTEALSLEEVLAAPIATGCL